MIDFTVKSNEDILKEVQGEIEEELAKIPPEVLKKEQEELSEKKKTELRIEDILLKLETEKEFLHNCTDEQFAEWIISEHNAYVSVIDRQVSQNFLDGETREDKYMILTYMCSLFDFLSIRDIDDIRPGVAQILIDKKEVDLVCILNVLGYI